MLESAFLTRPRLLPPNVLVFPPRYGFLMPSWMNVTRTGLPTALFPFADSAEDG